MRSRPIFLATALAVSCMMALTLAASCGPARSGSADFGSLVLRTATILGAEATTYDTCNVLSTRDKVVAIDNLQVYLLDRASLKETCRFALPQAARSVPPLLSGQSLLAILTETTGAWRTLWRKYSTETGELTGEGTMRDPARLIPTRDGYLAMDIWNVVLLNSRFEKVSALPRPEDRRCQALDVAICGDAIYVLDWSVIREPDTCQYALHKYQMDGCQWRESWSARGFLTDRVRSVSTVNWPRSVVAFEKEVIVSLGGTEWAVLAAEDGRVLVSWENGVYDKWPVFKDTIRAGTRAFSYCPEEHRTVGVFDPERDIWDAVNLKEGVLGAAEFGQGTIVAHPKGLSVLRWTKGGGIAVQYYSAKGVDAFGAAAFSDGSSAVVLWKTHDGQLVVGDLSPASNLQ